MLYIFWFLLALILLTFAFGSISAAPWLPTMKADREHLMNILDIKPGETIFDLGAGDGTILFALAAKYPAAKFIGYEVSLLPYFLGLIRKFIYRHKIQNVSWRYGDLFQADISLASTVLVFLLKKSYAKLAAKFKRELSPETKILVEAWPMPNMTPVKTEKQPGLLAWYCYRGSQFNDLNN